MTETQKHRKLVTPAEDGEHTGNLKRVESCKKKLTIYHTSQSYINLVLDKETKCTGKPSNDHLKGRKSGSKFN